MFLEKGKTTKEIWFFEHPLPEGYKKYTKTKPIRHEEFELEKQWWNNRDENQYAWKVSIEEIKSRNYNLDIKNPKTLIEHELKSSSAIIRDLEDSMKRSMLILEKLKEMVQ